MIRASRTPGFRADRCRGLVLIIFGFLIACEPAERVKPFPTKKAAAKVSEVAIDSPLKASQPPAAIVVPKPYLQVLPGTNEKIYMVPVPDGAGGGFWMSAKEITWDVYDHYIYGLGAERDVEPPRTGEEPPEGEQDAISRPSKPYVHPDRGFGHDGFAAISCSALNAECFCVWFNDKTKLKFRLPEEEEWERACLAGAKGPFYFADAKKIGDYAWFTKNSNDSPQAVGSKIPNSLGLYDMHGNASEWVYGRDGEFVQKGGCFWDEPELLHASARTAYDESWQMTDPQLPKSQWWLSDAPFAGLRIVRDFKDAK
ncbi:MAG: SUMF1/EgtB/PvdO family nonheme iron enzyme [Planctomycetota bacterium]